MPLPAAAYPSQDALRRRWPLPTLGPVAQELVEDLAELDEVARAELVGRITLWSSRVDECRSLLKMTLQMRARSNQPDTGLRKFPTSFDALLLAGYLPVLAAVMFSAIVKGGRAAPGAVAGNRTSLANRLWRSVVDSAFPAHGDATAFQELLDRLERGRDSMIAHIEGPAFNVSMNKAVMITHWPVSAAVAREDVEPWLTCLEPLSYSLARYQWLVIGGEHAEFALQRLGVRAKAASK